MDLSHLGLSLARYIFSALLACGVPCVCVCVHAIVIALAFLPAVFGLGPATFSGLPFEWLALFCVFAHCLPNDFACCCSCLLPVVASCLFLFISLYFFFFFFLLYPKTLFVALVVFVYHFWVNRAEFRAVYWTVKTMGKPSSKYCQLPATSSSSSSSSVYRLHHLPAPTPTPVPVSRGFCFVSQFVSHFNKFLVLVLFLFLFFSCTFHKFWLQSILLCNPPLTDWLWGLIITIAIN